MAKKQRREHDDSADDRQEREDEEDLPRKEPVSASVSKDIYLDTIRRSMLDFDFEKVCSVSLSNLNVYACLVCGKYFQGRGKMSHAYIHSLHEGHHVFANLHTLKIYVLPDGYEVVNTTLEDIKYVLNPTFTRQDVDRLAVASASSYDLSNKPYLPGYVGLNNLKANDYVNVVVHALIHIAPIRDFLLLQDLSGQAQITQRFGILVRKMWNPKAFKGQVSPHELLQEINSSSGRRFKITEQGDPIQFLSWFLNTLHADLRDNKTKTSIIHDTLQGEVRVKSQNSTSDADQIEQTEFDNGRASSETTLPFLFLALDLPPPPLFQDELEQNIIPQVSLTSLLAKYSGSTVTHYSNAIKSFSIKKLPRYMIFHIKRFVRNNFTVEKNPTIVNYAIKNLDMRDYVDNPERYPPNATKYDLIANICHEGKATDGFYKAHLLHKGLNQWLSIQDLHVDEILPQMIFLGESYIQVWERSEQ